MTGTFKMVKGDLRKQAYDIRQFDDPVYALLTGQEEYQVLDIPSLEGIESRNGGF